MKKHDMLILALAVLLALGMLLTGCGSDSEDSAGSDSETVSSESAEQGVLPEVKGDEIKVTASNGVMVGRDYEGVTSFKGIPYAKPPVEDLRWKAPVPAEDSDEEIDCGQFGYTSLQYEWPTEPASYFPKNEDCLTLNIWSSDENTDQNKDVMVWIHGGAFAWGGTTDPTYYGETFVRNNPNTILVTVNYRLGLMGWADFSQVPGGEDYTDVNLGIRDQICALEWVQKNIDRFGGNKDNVTIFGESAGGWSTNALLVSPMAKGLFQRVIVESGPLLVKDREAAQEYGKFILDAAGAENMEDLLAIDGDKWMELDWDNEIGDNVCGIVTDGEVISEDIDGALKDAAGRGIQLLMGSTAEEWHYFEQDAFGDTDQERRENFTASVNEVWNDCYDDLSDKDKAKMDALYDILADRVADEYAEDADLKDMLAKSSFVTETWRVETNRIADTFSKAGGETYVYVWDIPSNKDEYFKSACHAIELSYVLGNLDQGYGDADPDEAKKAQAAWTSFAHDGNPSIDGTDWPRYDSKTRKTMMILPGEWKVKDDPYQEIQTTLNDLGIRFVMF